MYFESINTYWGVLAWFLKKCFVYTGTVIDQGEAPDFYFQKYPEDNPVLGFFTWRWVLTLGFDHMFTSPVFFGTLALLGASLMACTYTTQIPLVKAARRSGFMAINSCHLSPSGWPLHFSLHLAKGKRKPKLQKDTIFFVFLFIYIKWTSFRLLFIVLSVNQECILVSFVCLISDHSIWVANRGFLTIWISLTDGLSCTRLRQFGSRSTRIFYPKHQLRTWVSFWWGLDMRCNFFFNSFFFCFSFLCFVVHSLVLLAHKNKHKKFVRQKG